MKTRKLVLKVLLSVALLIMVLNLSCLSAAAGGWHTVGIKDDNTVVAVGLNDEGQCNVGGWTNITLVAAGMSHTVGLQGDGKVVATGRNDEGQCDVGGWTNIEWVAAGGWHTVGVKDDGKVVAVGGNDYGQCNVGGWTNLAGLAAGVLHTVGLKNDYTVVATGRNDEGQCDVGGWTNIGWVAAGFGHTVGVKDDGTVVAVGKNDEGQCNVGGWTNITQVAAGYAHTVGLKGDGTVVAVGRNDEGQCDIGGWTNIEWVAAGGWHTVGVKKNGTVVAVGSNDYGQCNVDDWILRVPDEDHEEAPESIKVGMARDLDQELSFFECGYGGTVYRWFVDKVNAEGGIYLSDYEEKVPIELIVRNFDPATWDVAAVTEDLIETYEVDFIWGGPGTDCIFTQAHVCNAYGVLHFTLEGGASSMIWEEDIDDLPYTWVSQSSSNWYQIPVLHEMLIAKLARDPRAYITYIGGWMHGIEYRDKTINVFGEENVLPGGGLEHAPFMTQEDANTIISDAAAALASTPYDIFCAFTYPWNVAALTQAAIAQDFNPPAMIFGSGANAASYYAYFGPYAEGIMGFVVATEETSPELAQMYSDLAGQIELDWDDANLLCDQGAFTSGADQLDYWGHPCYVAGLEMWQQAIENAGNLDSTAVRDELAKFSSTNPCDTVLGDTWFTVFGGGNGGGILAYECHPGEIGQWQNRKYEIIGGNEPTATFDYPNTDQWNWLNVVTETVTDGTVDARDEANTEVEVAGTATVTVFPYDENPGGVPPVASPDQPDWKPLGKYIDVYSPDTTESNELEIRLYYTDDEVAAADISEESLRLFWWDGDDWVACSDSGVNTASTNGYSGYMWAKITATTTPSLADLWGTPWGGYGHPTEVGGVCGCFIATAAYGTDTAKEIDILREFRDTILLPNSLGTEFVSLYHKTSPLIANFISQHEVLRTAVRVGFVDPIVAILNWSHDLWSERGS